MVQFRSPLYEKFECAHLGTDIRTPKDEWSATERNVRLEDPSVEAVATVSVVESEKE